MKKTTHKKSIKMMFFILIMNYCGFTMYSQNIYVNDMDYVLGDAKQVFIRGNVTTQSQADNLLKGFIDMKVNGIRIPIFGRSITGVDLNPNKAMMDYFYDEAVKAGIPIFANPAQGAGGKRIANNMLNGETIPSVNNVASATAELIARMLEFSNEYPDCKWLNPFNEDGRAIGSTWTVAQIEEIYAALYNNVNGAELIGPCSWGLVAGIDYLKNSNIENYITVASTHNLGFNHNLWPDFIELADDAGLPVWDSEVNINDKWGNDPTRPLQHGTRIDSALENKVDGLVLYDSGLFINLTNGNLGAANEKFMAKYLKPLTNLARNGVAVATQSSSQRAASRAIDGNISGSLSDESLALTTNEASSDPSWQVDLKSNEMIGHVKIFGRTDGCCKAFLSDFTVTITNSVGTEVFTKNITEYPDQATVIETGGVVGQIVKIQQHASNTLGLAEVQVFAEAPQQLSIYDIDKNDVKVSMYPNPVNDKLTIVTTNTNFNSYVIYNVSGQVILKGNVENNLNELEINVSELSRGLYILKLNGDNLSGSYKIVKD